MHVPNKDQSDSNNPYIQIMFNINSKKVVNNNVLPDRPQEIHFDIPPQKIPHKIDNTYMIPQKKYTIDSKPKSNKNTLNKTNILSYKQPDMPSYQNPRPNKKSQKLSKTNQSASETQRSVKNGILKKNTSSGLSKLNFSEEGQISTIKNTSKFKSRLKPSKDARQKIIELMIKDYEKGNITAQNLKVAISSLIEKETQQKKMMVRPQSRSEKQRAGIPTSHKNSLAVSWHNTPIHKPSKSRSQKIHCNSYQPSAVLKVKQSRQETQEPEIIERVINRKEFVSKIIIKGINSSLFLSNEMTQKESPKKDPVVNVNVINTSDSVRDLKKDMHRTLKRSFLINNQDISHNENKVTPFNQRANQSPDNKKNDTKNLLNNLIEQMKGESKNQFVSSRYSPRQHLPAQSLEDSLKFRSKLDEMKSVNKLKVTEKQEPQQNSLDDFYIREDAGSDLNQFSSIHELQKQYALLLKDQKSQSNQSILTPNQIRKPQTRNENQIQPCKDIKLKSYVSSELQKKIQNSGPLSEAKLQMTQKRAKSVTQNQIKKLSQIMDVIKSQLTQSQQDPHKPNNQQILLKIVSLLQSEKNKVQQELKLYSKDQKNNCTSPNSSTNLRPFNNQIPHDRNNIEQNQIINSFQKKLKKINIFQPLQQNTQAQNNLIYYDAQDTKSISSSRKSLGSSVSSANHLQKVKISQLNLDQIQIGLRKRLNDLEAIKKQEFELITEKFINDKISPKQYQEEKEIIEKWFQIESRVLKRTKQNLTNGYKKAKEFLLQDQASYQTNLTRQKSNKMIKCISEKYLNRVVAQQQDKNAYKFQKNTKRTKSKKIEINIAQPYQNRKSQTIYRLKDKFQARNITPKQDFTRFQKDENEKEVQSPLSIFNSRLSQERSVNTSNSSILTPQLLMTLQQSQHSESFHNQIDQTDSGSNDAQTIQEYKETQRKRYDVDKVQNAVSQYLKNYQNESISSPKEDNFNESSGKDQKQQEEHKTFKRQSSFHVQDYSSKQPMPQYDGYNDSQEGFNSDEQSKLQQLAANNHCLTKDQALMFQQPQLFNIIVNKRAPSNQEELFSPKKQIIHQQFSQELLQYDSQSGQNQQNSQKLINPNRQFNQIQIKLKYLTEEDKDDIFEFMFLDLCLELFLEQTKNNKIIKSLERSLAYMRIKRKIPKGLKTGVQTCKKYITNIQEFLLNHHASTLKRLQCPMGPSAKQMLKYMRSYDDIQQSDSEIDTVNLVLPIEVYQKFEAQPVNKLEVQRYYDDDEKEQSRLKFLNSLKHFHNKAFFDSLNEMLDIQRCYGIWGKPFPWKKALDVDRQFDHQQIQKKLKQASQKVIQNCSYLCGVLVDKQESVFGKASNISDDYLHHIREDRMSKMLCNDMIDNQDRWIFYDDQETEVLMSIQKSIATSLIIEALQEIKLISWK